MVQVVPLGGTTSIIHTLDVDGTKEGFDKWNVIGTVKVNSSEQI